MYLRIHTKSSTLCSFSLCLFDTKLFGTYRYGGWQHVWVVLSWFILSVFLFYIPEFPCDYISFVFMFSLFYWGRIVVFFSVPPHSVAQSIKVVLHSLMSHRLTNSRVRILTLTDWTWGRGWNLLNSFEKNWVED